MALNPNPILEWLKLVLSLMTTVAVGYGAYMALKNWRLGEENRKISLQNTNIAVRNSELAARNTQIANESAENAARWKRSELAASYLQPLFQDEELVFALRCLDWGVGTIPIPPRHRAMMKETDTIVHDPVLLVKAMQPTLSAEVADSPQAILYRLALDALFTRFDWIAHRIGSGLITIEDVPDLSYWMKLLASWPYAPTGTDRNDVFMPFLSKLGYEKVVDMIRRFEKH
jgi:hypothetical protein